MEGSGYSATISGTLYGSSTQVPFFQDTRGSRPSHLLKKVLTSQGSFCTVGAEPLWE